MKADTYLYILRSFLLPSWEYLLFSLSSVMFFYATLVRRCMGKNLAYHVLNTTIKYIYVLNTIILHIKLNIHCV